MQAVHGLDRQLPFGHQFALSQRLICVALTLARLPRQIAAALLVTLLVQVLDRFEGDAATTVQRDVLATLQFGALVALIPAADQGQVTAGFDFAVGASPGGSLTIVNAAASIMKVRDQSEAKFWLTENYTKEIFDSEMWGPVESVRDQPLISAFPLFSFGDVLLLCPIKLIKTELKDWPEKSVYCVVTKKKHGDSHAAKA